MPGKVALPFCSVHEYLDRVPKLTLARLMRLCSPAVAARHYIHVAETHIAAGFGKFVEYQTRNVTEDMAAAFPQASEAVQ